MTDTSVADRQTLSAPPAVVLPVHRRGPVGWLRDPWREPRVLETVTWLYLAWSILPVLIAIGFSFNDGRSRSTWQGFSLRWWYQDPFDSLWTDAALRGAMFHTLALAAATMVVAVPMGVAFAIGLDRWRGRPARAANATVLFSFVVPEIVLGVSFFLLFTTLFRSVVGELNAVTQVIGLVTYQLSYAVIIVRARLLSIGKEYEEAAMDLGASPVQAVRRVLLPLLYPAIFASLAIVFADSVDDFVLVRYTCASAACEPLSVKIYSAARASPTPAVNAAATAMLVMTLVAVAIGFVAYRVASSGQRKRAADEFVGLQV